jgi:hypothetical protein
MNGPETLVYLAMGNSADGIDPSLLPAPYDEGARCMISANGKGRIAALKEWHGNLPEPQHSKVREEFNAEVKTYKDLRSQGQSAQPKRYTVHWASEALEPQPPVEWIVENLFAAASVSVVFGAPGCKKTWCMLDAAVCVAQGNDWLEFGTQQVTSLIVDEESGPRRLKRRLNAIMRAHDISAPPALAYTTLDTFNLREADDLRHLEALVNETHARFIVIDALADVMAGGDENAVRDMQPLLNALHKIANATQAAIVVIHHAGKNGEYRGSSSIHGSIDTMMRIASPPKSAKIDFKVEKQRDVPEFSFRAAITFEADKVIIRRLDDAGDAKQLPAAQAYVVNYLAEHGPSEFADIERHPEGCTPGAARQAVYDLKKSGDVERTDPGGPGVKATVDLTEQGRRLVRPKEAKAVPV